MIADKLPRLPEPDIEGDNFYSEAKLLAYGSACAAVFQHDAERYRYIVKSASERGDGWTIGGFILGDPAFETLDEAIDTLRWGALWLPPQS